MQFWRYDLDDALCWMTGVWWRPTSRPAMMVVLGVTASVLAAQKLASLS